MVEILSIIKPVFYGVVVGILLVWVLYMFYWLLKKIGIVKGEGGISSRGKISKEVLTDATKQVVEGKTFLEYAEYISKFPKGLQEQYIKAYYKVLDVMKGGVDND